MKGNSVMAKRIWQSALVAAGMALAASGANAASCTAGQSAPGQINPGTGIAGAGSNLGIICNGSTTSPTGGPLENAMFLGFNAGDTDNFTMQVNGTLFVNQTTAKGTATTVSVTSPLTLTLTNVSEPGTPSYNSGQGYTNTDGSGTPLGTYHFADFMFASAAAYDAFAPFDSVTGDLTSTEIAYINSHGGFGAFTFVGIEDLPAVATDDWNDLIVAVSAAPIPATLPLFAGGLAAFGLLGRRRKKASAAIAAA
jgi:hypothetical protein